MAHNLSQDASGNYQFISVGRRQDWWHQLGRYKEDGTPITEDELVETVGVDVAKVPVTYERPIGFRGDLADTVPTVSRKAFLTVRLDTGDELAMVGPGYEIVQHKTALVDLVMPVVEAGYATIEGAGLLRNGLRGFCQIRWNMDKFDRTIREVYGDELKTFAVVITAHGEGRSVETLHTTQRTGCENTLEMARADGVFSGRVAHRKGANGRVVDMVRDSFKAVLLHHAEMAEKYAALKRTHLDKALWLELVQKVGIPNPSEQPDWDPKAPRADVVMDRFKTKANRAFSLWTKGTNHKGDKSAWEAYNGLVESIDHDTDIWKTRTAEGRLESLTSGPFAKVKADVFDSLLAFASK